MNRMREGGVPPDVTTYTTIMSGCKRESDWRRAEALLSEMESVGIKPNSRTLTAVLKVCVFSGWNVSVRVCDKRLVGEDDDRGCALSRYQSPRWYGRMPLLPHRRSTHLRSVLSSHRPRCTTLIHVLSSHHATPHLLPSLPFHRIGDDHNPSSTLPPPAFIEPSNWLRAGVRLYFLWMSP